MRTQSQQIVNVKVQGTKVSAKMGIANPAWIIEILSKKLYSRPIYTVIQEYLSNGYDANVKAGRTGDPVVMTLRKNDSQQWYVAFTDFGVGMSEKDVFETFAQYGASDKQDSEDQIGMMGLGSKSAFSYVDEDNMFFVKTIKDGTLTEYMVQKTGIGEQEIYQIAPPTATDLPSGTSVWFYVKNSDVNTFVRAAKDRAAFIPNIIFDFDENLPSLKANVLQHEYFSYSPLNDQQTEMFVLLGNIPYRINWDEVGYDYRVAFPFAIRLSLKDGVYPTPNREDLTYDANAVKIIREKLCLAYGEIITLTNENYLIEDWRSFLLNKDNYFFKVGGTTIKLENRVKMEKLSGIKVIPKECPTLTNLGLDCSVFGVNNTFAPFNCNRVINKNTTTVKKLSEQVSMLNPNMVYYRIEPTTRFKSRTLAYLKQLYYDKTVAFVEISEKYFYRDFCLSFGVDIEHPNGSDIFFNVAQFQVDFFESLPKFEDVEVPKDFKFGSTTVSSAPRREKDKIMVYEVDAFYQRYKYETNLTKSVTTIEELQKYDHVFWGEKADYVDYTASLYRLLDGLRGKLDGTFIIVLVANKKDAEMLSANFMHLKDFHQHEWADEIMSSYLFNKKLPEIPEIVKLLVPNWEDILKKIDEYRFCSVAHSQNLIEKFISIRGFELEDHKQKLLNSINSNKNIFKFLEMFNVYFSNKKQLIQTVQDVLILNDYELKFEY
jgi:hypothetical protein